MASFLQYISGNKPQGIKFRTVLAMILTFSVLTIEIVAYYMYWDSIPNMVEYDYNLSGIANGIFQKNWIWGNVLLQIFICAFVFIMKYLLYKKKRIHKIVYDKNNKLIPIMDKRFSMLAWETAMLFVTTEQGYIFALINFTENRMCDDIVTIIFLFWQIVLIIEFISDLKVLKNKEK